MSFATNADLFFELGDTGDNLVDLFRQTALMFAGGSQQTLFLDQPGPGADDLILGARLLILEAYGLRIESTDTTLEGTRLLVEASAFRSGGLGPFFGKSCFGFPPIELAQRVGGFFAAACKAVGGVLDGLFELDTARLELRNFLFKAYISLVDFVCLSAAAVFFGGQ